MAKCQITNGKVYNKQRLESMAEDCGLVAAWRKYPGGWDWFISRDGVPCFQGDGANAAIWLQAYQRCLEDHGWEGKQDG